MASKNLEYYLDRFTRLRVDRARGVAPHKPTLLLAVIERFEKDEIQHNQICLTAQLIATFSKYWSKLVTTEHNSDISLPFFHLGGDGFWHFMPNPGFEATISSRTKIRGLRALQNAIKYAYVDSELFEYLKDPASRLELIEVIVTTWFPNKASQFESIYKFNELEYIQHRLFEKGGAVYTTEDVKDQDKAFIRNAAFRRNVVLLYRRNCALCKIKIISQKNQDIVDGAHIQPFAEFHDDRFDNGISLCKNHHWAFDHGWFGIDSEYKIVVPNGLFEQNVSNLLMLQDYNGEDILLPEEERFNPRIEALRWHRLFWRIAEYK